MSKSASYARRFATAAAVTDNDVWNDLVDDAASSLIPCLSGATMRVEARIVSRDTFSGESSGTISFSGLLTVDVDNLAGTIRCNEVSAAGVISNADQSVKLIGGLHGGSFEAQAVIVAGLGIKFQVRQTTNGTFTENHAVTAHVTIYPL